MTGRPHPRVAVISELPTPYRWPVFARLLRRTDLDLRVFFLARREKDRQWSFPFDPDDRVTFLPGTTLSTGVRRTVHYHINHTVFGAIRRGSFDTVVLPGYAMFASHAGGFFCRAAGVPYVIFSETTRLDPRPIPLRVVKRLLLGPLISGASAWLATGTLSGEYLASYGADPERTFRFPNSPDVDWFCRQSVAARPYRAECRRRLGAGEGPVVLFVARLMGVKRCDVLIRALAHLARQGAEPACWIAGDGPERESLSRLAREEGLHRVRFLGNRPTSELPGLYGAADLFVLPSDHEPWGAVVGEAMACGLPVVLSDRVGSGPDLVVPGENGEIFRHGEPEDLAVRIGRILNNPAGLQRMRDRSADIIRGFSHAECEAGFVSAVRSATRER